MLVVWIHQIPAVARAQPTLGPIWREVPMYLAYKNQSFPTERSGRYLPLFRHQYNNSLTPIVICFALHWFIVIDLLVIALLRTYLPTDIDIKSEVCVKWRYFNAFVIKRIIGELSD